MAKRLALSKVIVQPVVQTRSATGAAITFNPTHQITAPVVYQYATGFEVKDNYPTKQWALVIKDEDTVVDPSVASDPDVIILPAGWTMAMPMSAQMSQQANAAIAQTDLGTATVAGQLVKKMIADILVALNHSPGAEEWIFL